MKGHEFNHSTRTRDLSVIWRRTKMDAEIALLGPAYDLATLRTKLRTSQADLDLMTKQEGRVVNRK